MKRIYSFLVALFALAAMPLGAFAQGWPTNYGGVMLQGFSWDSYVDTQWSNLESQAQDFKGYFDLIWVPNSGNCNNSSNNMGYMPYYYFNQNSSFGTEAQLRSMIKTFKANGIGTIADVVVNHHNTSGWFSFPAETYNGVTYQLQSTDITANDDNGATATEAKKEGVSLSSNNDEGEDWNGCRDLDHKSENVQTIVKAYTKYLVEDLGYTGFRYDMVKGFSGSHVGDYNDNAGVKYSVGEYWDSNSSIENWINATGKRSAAFDFQFRYNVRDAINNNDWTKLNSDNNLIHDANYRQYAVTFVENHDLQDRGTTSGYTPDPILRDTLAANAYLLAMPGTPCVFLTHWKAYKQEIKSMILARKLAGITNTSTYKNELRSSKYYGNLITGTDGKQLAVVLGTGYNDRLIDATFPGFIKILSGYHYAYYLNPACETAWADKASGEYSDAFKVTLTAVSATSDAQLVYTLDGTTPTASSSKANSGSTIDITSDCTLTVGLLKNGKVDGIQTYNYTIKKFVAHKATVYFKDPQWTTSVYFYAWANDGKSTTLNGSWPGKVITATKEINGEKWYYQSFDINSASYSFNIIFNQGNGKLQTVDIGPISEDKYYELGDLSNGKYTYKDVTSTITTGIRTINTSTTASDPSWYTLSGVRLSKEPTQNGVYIHQGKKVVK
jgi:alpha-amylase